MLKTVVVVGGGVTIAGCVYAGYKLWNQKNADIKDEGFEDVSKV